MGGRGLGPLGREFSPACQSLLHHLTRLFRAQASPPLSLWAKQAFWEWFKRTSTLHTCQTCKNAQNVCDR